MQDPQPDFHPLIGKAEPVAPGLRRIVAPNASPMTFRGTNTYLLGTRALAVIDPGPDDPAHLDAILSALGPGQRISHIFVTHAHLDHSPLSRALARETGAPIHAFGRFDAGRRPVMQALAESGLVGGGEGVDAAFVPDRRLADGDRIAGDGWQLEALHTPGHMANHLSFAWGRALFSGDHVMGWASSIVSPPDGDLSAFMESLHRLQTRRWAVFHPGHGAPVLAPSTRLRDLIAHRLKREAAILTALSEGPARAADLAARIYTDVAPALLPAAERNVLAHLLDLAGKKEVTAQGPPGADTVFHPV